MNLLRNENGFTLIEISMALAISSIIVLTAGVIIISSSKDFERGSRQIHLQQDLSLASELLMNSIRSASGDSTIIYTDSSATIVTTNGNCLKLGSSAIIFKSGADLVYQNGTGQAQRLISNCVNTLDFSRDAAADSQKCINFRIALSEADCSIATENRVYFRN